MSLISNTQRFGWSFAAALTLVTVPRGATAEILKHMHEAASSLVGRFMPGRHVEDFSVVARSETAPAVVLPDPEPQNLSDAANPESEMEMVGDNIDDPHQRWLAIRELRAREEERFRKKYGPPLADEPR